MLPTRLKAVALWPRMFCHKWLTASGLLLCLGWLLGGCSHATGAYFRPAEYLAPQQAMIYLYFPRQSGYSDSRTILANGMTVTRLDEGGYYPFLAAPGRMTFSLSGVPEERNLTVTVEPGRTYFVKIVFVEQGMSLRFRSVVYQLFPVHEELAHAEMGPLRLMTTCHSTEGCVPIRK